MLTIVVCCYRYLRSDNLPFRTVVYVLSACFPPLGVCIYVPRCLVCCCGFFFLFPFFFWTFCVVFAYFCVLDTFLVPGYFTCFPFFLFSSARTCHGVYMHVWGVPGYPLHPHNSPILSVAPMCRARLWFLSNSAPHNLAEIMPYTTDCVSVCVFCVCCVYMHPPASI